MTSPQWNEVIPWQISNLRTSVRKCVRCSAGRRHGGRSLPSCIAHLEDHAAALEARGLSPEEATAQAVTAMGNPYALGHALDQTHPPTLPRLSRLFLAVGLLALFLGILLGLNRDSGLFALAGVVPQPPELSYDTGTPWY